MGKKVSVFNLKKTKRFRNVKRIKNSKRLKQLGVVGVKKTRKGKFSDTVAYKFKDGSISTAKLTKAKVTFKKGKTTRKNFKSFFKKVKEL